MNNLKAIAVTITLIVITPFILQAQSANTDLTPFLSVQFKSDGETRSYHEIEGSDYYLRMTKHLMSQGEGTFKGELSGSLSFSMLGLKSSDKFTIKTHFVGWFETSDGAEIMYEASGFSVLATDDPNRMTYTSTLRFLTSDEPYMYLENITALLTGDYNITQGTGSWNVYLPKSLQSRVYATE